MKIIQYLEYKIKTSNVLSFDTWVLFAVLALMTFNEPDSSLVSENSMVFGFMLSLMVLIAFSVFLIFCSRLREYRYLDIYHDCKKLSSKYKIFIDVVILLSATIAIIVLKIPISLIIDWMPKILIAFLLSVHYNNSKELQKEI